MAKINEKDIVWDEKPQINEDEITWDESPKQPTSSQGAGGGFQTTYTAPNAPTPNRVYDSTSPSASTSSVGVDKIEVPKVVPNDIRAYEYSQSKLRDQDKKIQKLKGLHNDIDMGDAPNALVVQNQYNQELEKSQKERVALSQSALIAQTKVNASLNNIVSSIDKNKEWNKFISTDNDGFENANIQAIDAYSRKVAKDSGAPETGYFQTLVKNKIKATAEYKIIEPDVNSQFEKLHKEKFGKTPSEYLGDDFAKAFKDGEKINKATNLELGAVQQELSTKAKEEVAPINDRYKTFAENLNVTYTQTQNDIQQKVAQLNDAYKSGKINQETYSSQFKGLEDNFKEVNDSYAKQIAESKKSYLDELNKINNKYNIQFKRQQSEIVRIANEQLKAEADKFTKAYKPNPKYVTETQELYSKAFENVSNASQKAKNIMDSYKGGGVRWVEGYIGTLGNSINGIATSLNMPNVALFGETLANEYKVGDSEIKSLKDLLDVNKMINSSSALAGGMTPSMLAAIPTGGASVALGAGALTAATISGLASWGVETMDMAGNTYNDILAQTGSVSSAKEASDKVIQSQVVLMPTYAIEMLPFIHGGLSKVKSKLGKVAAGAAIDYGSEYMQEFPQNIFEKNIREGREYNDLKVLTQDYTDFTKLAEQAKSTALNLLPMIGMGAMGGLNQSDKKNEISKKKINAIASSEILQQRFNKFNPYQFNQYIQGIYMAHGENFVQALAEASFANGTIDKEVYGKILDQKEKTKELVETSKSLGLSVSDSKLYNVLMSQFDEQMAKANNVEDVNAKAILIEKAKKYNQQAIDVLNLQEVPHVIVKYGNGIEMVWTQEQVENAMNDDAFIGNFINENIDIKLFNTESGFSNKLNEKVFDYEKREIERQEQIGNPIKYTSPTNNLYGYVEEDGVKRDLTKQEFEDYGKVDMEQQVEAAPTEESKGVGENTQAFTTDEKGKSKPIELSVEPSKVEEPVTEKVQGKDEEAINSNIIVGGLRQGFTVSPQTQAKSNKDSIQYKEAFDPRTSDGQNSGDSFVSTIEKNGKKYRVVGLRMSNPKTIIDGHFNRSGMSYASIADDGNLPSNIDELLIKKAIQEGKDLYEDRVKLEDSDFVMPSEYKPTESPTTETKTTPSEESPVNLEKNKTSGNAKYIEDVADNDINSGRVIIGYHATPNGNVDTGGELGIHIGTKEVAENVKQGRNNNKGEVKEVSFRVEKPLMLGDIAKWHSVDVLGELYRQKLIPIETLKEIRDSDLSEKEKQAKVIELIKENGYDSVAYKNFDEGNGEYSYILFDKKQLNEKTENKEASVPSKPAASGEDTSKGEQQKAEVVDGNRGGDIWKLTQEESLSKYEDKDNGEGLKTHEEMVSDFLGGYKNGKSGISIEGNSVVFRNEKGEPNGFAHFDKDGIREIGVDKSERGSGIASKMLNYLKQEKGIDKVLPPFSKEGNILSHRNEVKKAIADGRYEKAIENGDLTQSQVDEIVKSAGLQSLKETPQSEEAQPTEGSRVELPNDFKNGLPKKMVFSQGEWKQEIGGDLTSVAKKVQDEADSKFKQLNTKEDAIQESKAESVLSREQGKAGEAGSEREGVGQSEQGQEPTKESEEEVVTQAGGEGGDVEATAKALEGKSPEKLIPLFDVLGEVQSSEFNKQQAIEVINIELDLLPDDIKFAKDKKRQLQLKERLDYLSDTKNKEKEIEDLFKELEKDSSERLVNSNKKVAEAYHKAKADGSNPELVKAVEDLLESTQSGIKAEPKVEPTPEKVQKEARVEKEYKEAISKKSERAKNIAKENFINDNFDKIVSQMMLNNKIKRKC